MVNWRGKNIPACTVTKRHRWHDGHVKYGESCICFNCGYDALNEEVREA